MLRSTTIKTFVLRAALLVSLALFAATYLAASGVFTKRLRDNAIATSENLARGTFNAMYQIMREGWTRPQLEEFIRSIEAGPGRSDYRISIYRGELVSDLFGPIEQGELDDTIRLTLRTGQPQIKESREGFRYTYPLYARDQCIHCHTNAEIGRVLGAIDVRQDLPALIAETRRDLLGSLLLIAPLPLVVAFAVAVVLTRRINRSVAVLDGNIERLNRVADLTNIRLNRIDLG